MSLANQRLKVLIAGVLSLLAMIGVARFAYTPMLPVMQEQAGLSIAGGGWLAASNYLGYFTGAVIAASISSLTLKDHFYRAGLVLAVLTTVAMGLTESVWWWALWRYIAGLAAACGLLIGSGLIMHWLVSNNMRPELGIHFLGLGGGIAMVAAIGELMLGVFDWRTQWYIYTGIAIVLAVPAWLWLPKPNLTGVTSSGSQIADRPPGKTFYNLIMVAYFCAGVGYAVITTFIVAHINQISGEGGALAFMLLGIAAAPAPMMWDFITRKTGFINALALAFILQLVGSMLPFIQPTAGWAFAGALLFGSSFVGIVSMVLTMAGRFYPTKPAKMMGKMTLSYGVAQVLAPAAGGLLGDISGNYYSSLYMASAVMAIGLGLMLYIKAGVPIFAKQKDEIGNF
jgi:predicted MFS family arabinose efflux permease